MTNIKSAPGEGLGQKENRIWVGEDKIIHIDMAKDPLLEEDVWKLLDELKIFLKEFSGKAKIFFHINTPTIIRSSGFRKKTAEIIKEIEINPGYEKVAILVIGGILVKTIASFILVASGTKRIKIANNEEEAIKWLKS